MFSGIGKIIDGTTTTVVSAVKLDPNGIGKGVSEVIGGGLQTGTLGLYQHESMGKQEQNHYDEELTKREEQIKLREIELKKQEQILKEKAIKQQESELIKREQALKIQEKLLKQNTTSPTKTKSEPINSADFLSETTSKPSQNQSCIFVTKSTTKVEPQRNNNGRGCCVIL